MGLLLFVCFWVTQVASFRMRRFTRLSARTLHNSTRNPSCGRIRGLEYFEDRLKALEVPDAKDRARVLLERGQLLMYVARDSEKFYPRPYEDATLFGKCGHAMLSTTLAVSRTCVPGANIYLMDANLCTIHAGAISQNQLLSGDATFGRYAQSWNARASYLKKLLKDDRPTRKTFGSNVKTRLEWLRENNIFVSVEAARLLNNSASKAGCSPAKIVTALLGTSPLEQMVPFDEGGEYEKGDVPYMPTSHELLSHLHSAMEDDLCNEILADCPEEAVVGAFTMSHLHTSGGRLVEKTAVLNELNRIVGIVDK